MLVPGHRYRVLRDNAPLKQGDVVRFVRRELRTYDKGDTSDLHRFVDETTGREVVMEHFGDARSAPLADLFAPVDPAP